MAEAGHPWKRHWGVPDTARNHSCSYLPSIPLPHSAPLGFFPAGWTPAGLPLETKADLTSLGQHCTGSNQFFHQRDTQQQVNAEEEKALKTGQPNCTIQRLPFFFPIQQTEWKIWVVIWQFGFTILWDSIAFFFFPQITEAKNETGCKCWHSRSVLSACAQPLTKTGSLSLTLRGLSGETHRLVLIHMSIITAEETTESTERLLVTTGTL